MTYVSESLPDFFLFTFLQIAYTCSPKPTPLEEIPPSPEALDALHLSIERSQEVARKPMSEISDDPDYSSILYREEFSAPIAFLRLLLMLSERRLLSKIPSWSKIPPQSGGNTEPGMKKPRLSQLKQITSQPVVRKFLSMALKRVRKLREIYGRREVEEGKLGDARWSYACGAELSAAIVGFLESPEAAAELKPEFLDDTRKELVLCLGNAAEMLIRGGKHFEGLEFASAAVAIGTGCAGLAETVMTKNKNRYENALNAMR